tara:strand:- start:701 stop:1051 length:351 start_codon:yes stop_codon:yes gene_type:complete
MSEEKYQNFAEFYPFYITEHQNRTSRLLHVLGTGFVLSELIALIVFYAPTFYYVALPLTGYGFAWVGHFFFEKNRPATFQYPLWSLRGDFLLFWEVCTGKRGLNAALDPEVSQSKS